MYNRYSLKNWVDAIGWDITLDRVVLIMFHQDQWETYPANNNSLPQPGSMTPPSLHYSHSQCPTFYVAPGICIFYIILMIEFNIDEINLINDEINSSTYSQKYYPHSVPNDTPQLNPIT